MKITPMILEERIFVVYGQHQCCYMDNKPVVIPHALQ